jgi:hypothetical protein
VTSEERTALKAAVDAERRKIVTLPRNPPADWHGTENGYTRHDCRCRSCRRAARLAREQRRVRNQEQREALVTAAWTSFVVMVASMVPVRQSRYRRVFAACGGVTPARQKNQARSVMRMLDQAKAQREVPQ